MDWSTLIQTFVGAGVGTAAVTGLISIYREHRHKKAQAAYMAMRLAVELEAFAADCSNLIASNSIAEQGPDQQFPDWNTEMPEIAPYPDDPEGWRAIDRKLAGRCLNFRNKIVGSRSAIAATVELSIDDLENELNEHIAARGLEAWQLAAALRRRHSVEDADVVWSFAGQLEETLRKAEKTKEDRAKAQSSIFNSA